MCKTIRAKIFRDFAPNLFGTFRGSPQNPPAPKLRNSQSGSHPEKYTMCISYPFCSVGVDFWSFQKVKIHSLI